MNPKQRLTKPLTSKDREQYVHKLRTREGRIAWTVNKSRFGQNDILGCIDTISYSPWDVFLDQTSTVHHISDKRAEITRMLKDARDMGIKLSITQGYDIRKVFREPDRAQQLADYKPWSFTFRERMLYIAWDLPQYEVMVRKGIEYLLDAGFRPKEITCYVLVGFKTTFQQDIYRVNDVLRNEYHVLAYVMPYNNRRDSQEINNLRRWANKRQLYASMDFRDYNMHFRSKAMEVVK